MVTRVATFAMSEKMLSASLKTQARMADMQLQQASGSVSQTYGGLGASAQNLAKLEVSLTRSESYSSAANEAVSRIEVMYDALSSMTDILTSLRSDLAVAMSVDSGTVDLAQTAQIYLEQFAGLLNTQYEGRYLFAGAATLQKPVDISAYTITDIEGVSSGFYRGDATLASVQASATQTVTYGVTADNSAFEKALRVLSYLAASDGSLDSEAMNSVSALLLESLDATTAVQSRLSLNAAALERASASQIDYQDSVANNISAIRDTDITAVAAKLSLYETQLQASYAALARLQSISLVDYL